MLNASALRLATLWRITKTDASVLYFTDHDDPIQFEVDGTVQTFVPAGGIEASAHAREDGFRENNFEARAFLSSGAITAADIYAGLYREAKVDEWLVDWRFAWGGAFRSDTYWITDIRYSDDMFVAQVEGVSRRLRVKVGDVISRVCRWDLGDSKCGVAIASHTESHTVTLVEASDSKRIFYATGITGKPDDYFNYGLVTFTSGANNGLKGEVKDYRSSDDRIVLQIEMPYAVEVGDTFDVYPGCGKTTEYCKGTTGDQNRPWTTNIINFGGFPFVPGTDKILVTPNAR